MGSIIGLLQMTAARALTVLILDSVEFSTVADLDHPDGQLGILYRIDDAVISLAKAVFFLAGEFFATKRPGICGKVFYSLDDPSQVVFWDGIQILPDRILEKEVINGHWP